MGLLSSCHIASDAFTHSIESYRSELVAQRSERCPEFGALQHLTIKAVEEVIEHTGFAFECPATVPTTPAPSADTLRQIRNVVAPKLAEPYPKFAAAVFGIAPRHAS